MKDFGSIIYRTETKAYVIYNGTYTVPHPDDETVPTEIHAEFDALYAEVDEYAKANPDKVVNKEPYVPTIDELKVAKLTEINSKYDAATSSIVSTYPSTELLTFDKQEKEASQWKADNSVETPFLDGLAEARGIDKAELVDRVIVKAEAFEKAISTFTGLRQKYEDQLILAKTAEDITAIVPEYPMPEATKVKLSPYYDL